MVLTSSNDLPLVTICVPVRNGAKTIERTLNSILAQDYPNFEVIVSDNCSEDETANIVQQFAPEGVQYFLNPELGEVGESNWNYILSLAKGPLIALYHADDKYDSSMVSKQVDFLLTHPQACSVFTMTQWIDEKDRPIKNGKFHLPADMHEMDTYDFSEIFNVMLKYLNSGIIIVPTLMTRRETLDTVGNFSLKYKSAADLDLWLRMALWKPIGIIDQPLHQYRKSTSQGSYLINITRISRADVFRVLDAYLADPEIRQYATSKSLLYYEMHKISDDIIRATNLTVQGDNSAARFLLKSVIMNSAYRAGLSEPTFRRQFILGFVLYLALHVGLGGLAGVLYKNNYQPWRRNKLTTPC